MSDIAAFKVLRHAVTDAANQIVATADRKKLYDETTVGKKGGLSNYSPTFDVAIEIADLSRKQERLLRVAYADLERLKRYLNQIKLLFGEAIEYTTTGTAENDGANFKARIASRFVDSHRELISSAPTVLTIFLPVAIDTDAARINELKREFEEKIIDFDLTVQRTFTEKNKTIDDILERARAASGKAAVADYSRFFEQEAKQSRFIALIWLGVSTIMATVFGYYLIKIAKTWAVTPPSYTPIQAIQVGAAKLALFTVGIFAITWAARAFKAQWHVYITNKHRANALNSIEAFANATKVEANREAIIVHACAAIFSQTTTGFIPDQNDAAPVPSILEIIRNNNS